MQEIVIHTWISERVISPGPSGIRKWIARRHAALKPKYNQKKTEE